MIKCIVSLLILIMCGLTSRSQEAKLNALDSFSGLFVKKLSASESEKAFLTVSKSIYKPGEVIWFRAFLVHSISEKISVQSKYLFVDLVDKNDHVISTSILNANQQQTNGRISLADSVSTGYYWVRAYTQQMASSDTNNIGIVPIYILNPADGNTNHYEKRQVETSAEIEPILEIFPEGGSIMTGINTTVAFYLHDQYYHPISLKGIIKDSRDTLISEFTTDSYGLGKAMFSPSFFYKYKAVINYNGKEKRVEFPPFNRFAGQLSVSDNAHGNLKCRVILEDSIYRKDEVTYILGYSKNEICFAGIGYGSYETNISLQKFPDGIATLLLFNKDFKLLSERNIYVKQNTVNVKIGTDKEVYSRRSKGNLSVSVTDQNNNPLSSSLAVSISDSLTEMENESYFNTTAALKAKEGTLSNWDIIHINSISQEDLDLLMMCMKSTFSKGFLPKEQLDDNDQVFYISGKVIDKKGLPLSNKDLTLFSNSGATIFADTTNASGKFNFGVAAFPDSTQFVIHVNNKNRVTEYPEIVLNKISFPSFHTPLHLKLKPALSNTTKTKFLKIYADTSDLLVKNDWLKPVSVKTKAKPGYDHSGRISSNTTVITSEELMKLGTGNIGLAMLRVPGVIINNGNLTFYGSDQIAGANTNSEPAVLYDGNLVSLSGGAPGMSPVIAYLNTLNPRVIEFIEVIKGPEASVYGLRGGTGVIYIHSSSTIKEDFKTDDTGEFKFIRQGIAKPVLYPPVNYTIKDIKDDASFIDTRSTLFWNGNELTDNKGNINYIFYTNDIGGTYKVTITGVTIHGDLIYKTLSIKNQ